jgi:putative tryptophan/tyrosine transport system substrate-binding protein
VKSGNRHEATAGRKGAKLSLFGFVLLSLCCSAAAQQPTRVSRIGYPDGGFASTNAARINGFRQGLRDLGYIEGKNIIIEYRHSEGRRDRIAELSAELVRLKVDVIVAGGGGAAIDAAKQATKTIPIVMPMAIDPVEQGFVTSLARPGGNVTGLATLAPEISGKQLDILREIVPKLSHVGVLGTSTNSANARLLKEVELAAQALHLKIQYLDVKTPVDFESAFRSAGKGHAEAMLVLTGPIVNAQRKEIADLAAKKRLPAIFPFPEYVEAGGLMSYGASVSDSYRRAATYVDKILKGAKPIDLPVEQPAKFEFIVNLKAAKQIGLSIPQSVLARADRVIK